MVCPYCNMVHSGMVFYNERNPYERNRYERNRYSARSSINIHYDSHIRDTVRGYVLTSDGVYKIFKKGYASPNHRIISAYKPRHDGIMWNKDIYRIIVSFLMSDEHHLLCCAHKRYPTDYRPNPHKLAPLVNPKYVMWSLRRLPIRITPKHEHSMFRTSVPTFVVIVW